MATRRIQENLCQKCHGVFKLDDFYKKDDSITAFGVTHLCKECINKITLEKLKKHGSMEATIFYMCALLDYPFIKKVYESYTEKIKDIKSKTPNYMGIYLLQLSSTKKKTDKWNDFSDSDVDYGSIKKLRVNEAKLEEEIGNLKLVWGNYTMEDLQYLEYTYSIYTDNLPELTVPQESLFRDLCKCELRIRQKNEALEDVDKDVKGKMELMKRLKIDDFTIGNNKEDIELFLEGRIAIVERSKPAFHYEDKYKNVDFSGYEDYMEDHLKRPFRNLLTGSKEYKVNPKVDPFAWFNRKKKDE